MPKIKIFGDVLSRIRKERGFSGAHQFFHSVGGRKTLGLSFVSYWDIERGKKLPHSWRLKDIMAAMGVEPASEQGKELIRAFFTQLTGSDELLTLLTAAPTSRPDLPSRELAEAAASRTMAQLSVNLTLEQWRLCSVDFASYICQYYLANTSGWVTVKELAAAVRLGTGAVDKALKSLASGKLVEYSRGRARGLLSGKIIQPLPQTAAGAAIRAHLDKNWAGLLEGSRQVTRKRWTVRMTAANLAAYRQHLEKAVTLCELYADDSADRQGSAIYSVDAGISMILPR